jgi:hypothetical protein
LTGSRWFSSVLSSVWREFDMSPETHESPLDEFVEPDPIAPENDDVEGHSLEALAEQIADEDDAPEDSRYVCHNKF